MPNEAVLFLDKFYEIVYNYTIVDQSNKIFFPRSDVIFRGNACILQHSFSMYSKIPLLTNHLSIVFISSGFV